ncbi:MAG: Gfo/Idh/MocA family oxidoreductase [Nitrospirae bacterium]|nr:Gfo/Idh/MocA family oxidoreductase [Nitrospirota bacterium]
MSDLRIALIGVGAWGERYVNKLLEIPGIELAGLFDADPERLKQVCGRFGVQPLRAGLENLSGLSAAIVATPTTAHHEVAVRCLERGLHLLVEKPLARSESDAQDLVARARRLGRVLQVGHVERFNAAWRRVEPYVRRPMYLETQRLAPFRERGTDVDVVLDLMIHDVDLVLSAARAEPSRVDAVGVSVLSREVDMVTARLEFPSGLVCNLTASRVSPETVRKIRLFQPDGYYSADLLNGVVRACRVGPEAEEKRLDETREAMDKEDPLRLEIEDFVAAVRGGRPPRVTGEDGLRALRTALRIREQVDAFLRRVGAEAVQSGA